MAYRFDHRSLLSWTSSGSCSLPGILRPVDVQAWWSGGELVPLELSGTEQGVFVRREGRGRRCAADGFPSSSHDWAKVAPALAERYALTMPDLLGFGASSKPRDTATRCSSRRTWSRRCGGARDRVAWSWRTTTRSASRRTPDAARGRHARGRLARAPLHEWRPLPGPAPAPARAGSPTRSGAGAADKRRDERRVVHRRPRADIPGGVRLGCRCRRDLAELPPAQRTGEHASPDPLHRGPPRERRALRRYSRRPMYR